MSLNSSRMMADIECSQMENRPAQPAQRVPEINYTALIEAAFATNKKWVQGTNGCIAFARGAEWFRKQAFLAAPSQEPVTGNWIAADDVDRLARELDVAMNGEEGSAKHPSLCDVVAQARALLSAPSPAQEPVTLTDSMIDAADDYLRRFKHWHGLPAEFRWHEMWDAMIDAALREKQGGV